MKVSAVGFGCMSLKSEDKDHAALVNKAIDSGITLFDTADLYEKGSNEMLLGKALKGNREKVLISTKVGNRWKNDGSGWEWCPRKEYILAAADKSLHRLKTDYIDLYLLHGGTIEDPFDECIEAFERLKEQGKIRAYGISSIRPNTIREYTKRADLAAVMTQYSLLDRRPEEEIIGLLQKQHVGILARGTVAGGLLVDKSAKAYLGHTDEEIRSYLSEFSKFSPTDKVKLDAAIGYALSTPAIATAVVGIRTEKQLQDAISTASKPGLNAATLQTLQHIFPAKTYTEHR